MDKLKDKLKKGLKLGSSSGGSGSIFSSKPQAFKGTGHRLGSAEPKPVSSGASSSVSEARPRSQEAIRNQFAPIQPPSGPAPAPHAPATAISPTPPPALAAPTLDADVQADEAVLSAVDQLSTDPHCASASQVLCRLLDNILTAPTESKYRKIRLSNPKIQSAVVATHGGVELLLACGFSIVFQGSSESTVAQEEGYAVLEEAADLEPLKAASALLHRMNPSSTITYSANVASPSKPAPAAAQAPVPEAAAPRQIKERDWEAPRARNTKVILPVSIDTDVPSWFFERTGAELKAAFLAAVKKRESNQILMTKAMRERMQAGGKKETAETAFATVKVRLPEGISLQGEFGPGEPVAVVFAWVADSLSDPLQTFDLVMPDRNILELERTIKMAPVGRSTAAAAAAAATARKVPASVREAGLVPSITLNLRWTGPSVTAMKGVPALRRELMTQIS